MKLLFLRNAWDNPGRYNYELNYGWVDTGAEVGLYEGANWSIRHVPRSEFFNAYLKDAGIDCIVSLVSSRGHFEQVGVMAWMELLKEAPIPVVLRAGDSCYASWSDPFYAIWDHIFYRMPDKDGRLPAKGSFIPWCINTEKYPPRFGGEEIVMVCACSKRKYPSRMVLRQLNQIHRSSLFVDKTRRSKHIKGPLYIECLQNARAMVTTGSPASPETRGKVLEAAACGALIITPPTKHLELYFDDDQVFMFNSDSEFVEVCKRVKDMDPRRVCEMQRRNRKHVEEKHGCELFVTEHILPVIESLKGSRN